ncbi:MAG: hypothetical protein Q7R81_00605 [Candidatus Peregrinibacteria bacterium]|nr:hypothetical protein [Candidatus Peregrinibacteria bacterium]
MHTRIGLSLAFLLQLSCAWAPLAQASYDPPPPPSADAFMTHAPTFCEWEHPLAKRMSMLHTGPRQPCPADRCIEATDDGQEDVAAAQPQSSGSVPLVTSPSAYSQHTQTLSSHVHQGSGLSPGAALQKLLSAVVLTV